MVVSKHGRFGILPMVGFDPGGSVGEKSDLHLDAGFSYSFHYGKRPLVRMLEWPKFVAFEPNVCHPVEILRLVNWWFLVPGCLDRWFRGMCSQRV